MEGDNNNISEGAKEKQAVSFLLIEILLLVFIVGGVLFVLDRSGVVSISKLIGKASPTPTTEKGQDLSRLASPPPTPTLVPITGQIELVSDIPSYTATLSNQANLLPFFKEWGVFGKVYPTDLYESINPQPLRKVTVHLTQQQQRLFLMKGTSGITTSSGLKFTGDNLDLYIYIEKGILEDSKRDSGKILLSQTLTTLYGIAKDVNTPEKLTEENKVISDTISKLNAGQTSYFKVIKK